MPDTAVRRSAPTLQFVEQAQKVAELLDAGYSNRRIAERLGVSGPRVSQIRQQLPTWSRTWDERSHLSGCAPIASSCGTFAGRR